MADSIVSVHDTFWNIRGSFKLGGVLDIGTQCSLATLDSGNHVLIDAYTMTGAVRDQVMQRTDQGRSIEAIFHLHPFHTVHVPAVAAMFPHALHYGSARHRARAPEVKWSPLSMETSEMHETYADAFAFQVPRGVDFISSDERLHFSSVLVTHLRSRSLHVDDTLMWTRFPLIGGLGFHPTLANVLEKRAGAATDFREWAEQLAAHCASVDHLCTAHLKASPPESLARGELEAAVRAALGKVDKVLRRHQQKWG